MTQVQEGDTRICRRTQDCGVTETALCEASTGTSSGKPLLVPAPQTQHRKVRAPAAAARSTRPTGCQAESGRGYSRALQSQARQHTSLVRQVEAVSSTTQNIPVELWTIYLEVTFVW